MIPLGDLLNRSKEMANYYMVEEWPENKYLDLVHGFPHLERLCGFLTKTMHGLSSDIPVRLVIVSVCFHDIGRHLSGDHAENSANIFSGERLFENVRAFFYAREVEMIKKAIRLHTRGLMGLTDKEKNGLRKLERNLVASTVAYDNLDTLGQPGYARTFHWALKNNIPFSPSDKNREVVKKILCGEVKDVQPYRGIKKDDLVSRLAYNLGAMDQIVKPIKSLLGLPLLNLIEREESETKKIIATLIDSSVKKPRLS